MKVMTGAFTGTGTAFNVDTVGFKPGRIEFFNRTGLTRCVFTKEMPAASLAKQINHATVQHAFVTTNGVTLRSAGFTVGTDADINTSGELVYWTAYETGLHE